MATSKQPDFEFKDKTGISASEVLAYFKAVVNECCMLTFGDEKARLSKLISKVHRYLVASLPLYQQRCVFTLPEIPAETDAAEAKKKEIAAKSQVLCHWFDFAGQTSTIFYILGPFDSEATKERLRPTSVPEEEITPEIRKQRA